MADAAPASAAAYLARFQANHKITGFGVGNVHTHCPCPFCAAADFLVFEILETETAMAAGAVCRECGRGAKAIMQRGRGRVGFEFVQTVGPEPPDWLQPRMRRLG